MLSINTNLSSLIAQSGLNSATLNLNQAVERMSTGYKINHAKDNAANYSISTNLTTRIGAYQVAEDNAMQGLDMINTATENLSLIENKLSRLRALAIQSSNGTYGTQSREAINAEANSLVEEINRLYSTAEYNGIKLFDNVELPPIPSGVGDVSAKEEYGGFIADPVTYSETQINNMTKLSSISDSTTISSGEYAIWTAEDLGKLAKMADDGYIQGGTFVLADDIDMKQYCATYGWVGINTGPSIITFDGNGNIISNLTGYGGVFLSYEGEVKNLGLKNINISGLTAWVGSAGAIAAAPDDITNCFAVGGQVNSAGGQWVGGLGGEVYGTVLNCYTDISVIGGNYVGGLVGCTYDKIETCYVLGKVKGSTSTGGIAGWGCDITNSYVTGNVIGDNTVGGLAGYAENVVNCYVTGSVKGQDIVGGFLGCAEITSIINSCSYSKVTGNSNEGNVVGCYDNWGTDLLFSNVTTINNGKNAVGAYSEEGQLISDYDLSVFDANVTKIVLPETFLNLQIGINANSASCVTLGTSFDINGLYKLNSIEVCAEYLDKIDNLLLNVSDKQTELGAMQNRLESALDEISTQYENLVSTRSTIRDADIAEVSASYIQQQILQQAASTLLATANQTPSIALQLL